MEREERLKEIAKELYEAKVDEKETSNEVKALREEFFRLHDESFRGKESLLPVRTIEVPDLFFHETGMDKSDFVESRFPGWEVEHCEYNPALKRTVFVLRRDPQFISGVVEVDYGEDMIRVSKEISEFYPEIDWFTLTSERPDLANRIGIPVTHWELDEYELEQAIEDDPEVLSILQRHMKVRTPTIRATARRVKRGTEIE